eukprot:4770031-Amphidinium_carterae.1
MQVAAPDFCLRTFYLCFQAQESQPHLSTSQAVGRTKIGVASLINITRCQGQDCRASTTTIFHAIVSTC